MKRTPVLAFAILALAVTPALGTDVLRGHDLWSTPAGGAVEDFGGGNTPDPNDDVPPIPADFFGPGSDPFFGEVRFQGVPLGTHLGTPTGDADTIVERLSDTAFGNPPQDTIPIEIVALSLVSTEPIVVTFGGTNPQQWDVSVGLAPTQPQGTMTILHDQSDPDGGTYSAVLPICPILTFSRSDGTGSPIQHDHCAAEPPQQVAVVDQPWVHEAVPPLISQLSGPNFFVVGQTVHDGPHPQADPVEDPSVPAVPAATMWVLLALALLLIGGLTFRLTRRTA